MGETVEPGGERDPRGRAAVTQALVLLALGLALRLPLALAASVGSYDEVSFTLALHDYDLLGFQPHFPGYPLLVLAGRAAMALTAADAAVALALVAAVASAATAPVVAALARTVVTEAEPAGEASHRPSATTASWAAGLLVLLAPVAWTVGARPLSDAPGLLALALGALLVARARDGAGGLLAGIGLGLRPSLAPAALALLLGRRPARTALGLALGVAAWLVPIALSVGPSTYAAEAVRFTGGHFGAWGGSALTDAALADRPLRAGGALAGGLGLWWPGAPAWLLVGGGAVVVGAALAARRGLPRTPGGRVLLGLGVGWALFLLAAQNVDRPRHVLPLLPPLAVGLGLGLAAPADRRARLALCLAAILPIGAAGALLAAEQRVRPSPARALVAHVLAHEASDPTLAVFGGRSIRLFDALAPRLDARRARDGAALERQLRERLVAPGRVLATSEVLGDHPPPGWRCVARFERARAIDGPDAALALYAREGPP